IARRELVMARRAQPAVPYATSPALAQTLAARRPAWRAVDSSRGYRLPHFLLFGAVLVAFLVSAGAVVAPQVAPLFGHYAAQKAPAGVVSPTLSPVSRADIDAVLSYAQQMRPDDALVQVRPGVFAKRSNVQGVQAGGRTVYYDLAP